MKRLIPYFVSSILFLVACNSPYSEKLYPTEQYLQGGWYRLGIRTIDSTGNISDSIYAKADTNTAYEMFFFNGHSLIQYVRQDNYVELFSWSFLADSSTLYRKSDSISLTSNMIINGDTLMIMSATWYQYSVFCRYHSMSLPRSWPDSVVNSVYHL